MDHRDLSAFVKSERFVHLLALIGFIIIALVIFDAGIAVGFHKASFAQDWEKNYEHNFGAPGMMGLPGRSVPNPHGAAGRIVSVSLPTISIASEGENEKTVTIDSDTIIRDGASDVSASALTVGNYATVIGAPDASGQIVARLIRILPPPPGTASSSAATSTNP